MRKMNVDLVCDIAELISHADEEQNRKDILRNVVDSVARHMHADVCSIYIYDEEKQELALRATQGLMVELPAAVEVVEELAQEADFLSIGSNDLVQYMLAVDRTNEQVSNLYLSHHPAILRVINRIVSAAHKYGKDVSICGDLATDPRLLPFLVGIGLRKFSIDIVNAPAMQKLLESLSLAEAREIAQTMLGFGRISEVEAFLERGS